MCRRHFVRQSAIQQGKPAPVPLTRNFIDFLIMYGQFGGDVHPSDDEQSDNDDQNDLETQSLLNRPPNVKIEGTSKKKAFFMILKVYCHVLSIKSFNLNRHLLGLVFYSCLKHSVKGEWDFQ